MGNASFRDSANSADAFRHPSSQGARNESTALSESLHAVVDHDGDRDHGYGAYHHPDQDGPDASKQSSARARVPCFKGAGRGMKEHQLRWNMSYRGNWPYVTHAWTLAAKQDIVSVR